MENTLLAGIFVEGLLSFLSPCVLPLIPLYMSYLAKDGTETDEEGNVRYDRKKVFVMTLAFVAGICMTFVILSLSVGYLRSFIDRYRSVISVIFGTLLIISGLHETGIIHIDVLNREFRLKNAFVKGEMNLLKAFLMGLFFSLGWSPCIGPLLANAIFMASTSPSGYLYILAYALGLVIPFLVTGLFTSAVLDFFKNRKKFFSRVMALAGIVLIAYGCYMIHDGSRVLAQSAVSEETVIDEGGNGPSQQSREELEKQIMDHVFTDIEGKQLRLSDYSGKYVFLNFTTTWCTYCKAEIPEYYAFSQNEEVECLYVMTEKEETSPDAIREFAKENDIALRIIDDTEGYLFYNCGISAFPTVYVIDPESHFTVYYSGATDREGFASILDYARNLKQEGN